MSAKNRKKNIRFVTVKGSRYAWMVSDFNCDGDGDSNFNIWRNGNLIHDSLIHNEIVTPRVVREKILSL